MILLYLFIFTVLDTLWIKRYYPQFIYPKYKVACILMIMCLPHHSSFSIFLWGLLVWMGIIDHHFHHLSDFSLWTWTSVIVIHAFIDPIPLSWISGLYVLPFVGLSCFQERVGWGDSWIVVVMGLYLNSSSLSTWILLFVSLALLYALRHQKTKSEIALVPFMAIAYGCLLILHRV